VSCKGTSEASATFGDITAIYRLIRFLLSSFLRARWRGYSLRLDGTTFAIASGGVGGIMKAAEFIGNLILCLTVIYAGVNLVFIGAAIAIGWLHL
jgi:hypothetical protein